MYRCRVKNTAGVERGYANLDLSFEQFCLIVTTGWQNSEYDYYDSSATDSGFTDLPCVLDGVYDLETDQYLSNLSNPDQELYAGLDLGDLP